MIIGPFTSGRGSSGPFGGGGTVVDEGESEVAWNLLSQVEQVNGAPVDPTSMGTTGTVFNTTTGTFTLVATAHVTQVDGYQENVCRVTTLLTDLIPDFNPELDIIEICLSLDTWPRGTVELGIAGGIVDSATIDGSLQGGVVGVRTAGLTQDAVQVVGAANFALNTNFGLVNQVLGLISFTKDTSTSNWRPHMLVSAIEQGTTVPRAVHGTEGVAVMRASTLADWRMTFFFYHQSADSLVGVTAAVRCAWRRHRRLTRPLI